MKKLFSVFLAAVLGLAPVAADASVLKAVASGPSQTTGADLDNVFGTGATIEPESLLRTGVGTYATQNYYFFNNDPANASLLALRGCLDGVVSGAGNCTILAVGDSTTLGFGSAGTGDRKALSYPTQFANMLNAAGINASWQSWMGCGDGTSCNNDARITVGAGWTDTSGDISIGGYVASITSGVTTFDFTPTVPINSCTVYYITNTSNGTFSWLFDGANGTGTQSTAGTSAFSSLTVTPTSGLGTHTLHLGYSSGGTVEIIGTICSDTTKKWVNIVNAGWSGSEAGNWNTAVPAPWDIVSAPATFGANVTLVDLGINSWNNGTSVGTFKTQFAGVLTNSAAENPIIVTPAPSATSVASVATQQTYVTAMYQDAGTTIPLVDEYQRIGTYAAANALVPSWYYNTLHPSATGYMDFAGAVYGLTAPLVDLGSLTTSCIYNNIAPNDISNSSIAIGKGAMANTVAGYTYNDTAVGVGTLTNSGMTSAAINNTAIGNSALPAVTSGNSNTAVGSSAGHAVSSGSTNTFMGYNAGFGVTTSGNNTAIGYDACFTATTNGSACTAVGALAFSSSTGQHETGVGIGAAEFVSSGAENTAVGYDALLGITGTKTTGAGNTAVGSNALVAVQGAGANNVGVGYTACNTVTSGSTDTCIGEAAEVSAATDTAEIVIGAGVTGNGSDTTTIGLQGTTTTVYIPGGHSGAVTADLMCYTPTTGEISYQASNCTVSLRALKHDIKPYTTGLKDAMALQPSTFILNPQYDPTQQEQIGVIAEDTVSVNPDLGGYTDGKLKTVAYDRMGVVAIAAIQAQQQEIEDLKAHTALGFHKCFFGLLMCAD